MPLSTWLNTVGLRTTGLRTAARRLLILRLDPWHLVRDIGYRRQNLNLYCAGFLRSLGVGLLGVILAVYLSRAGVGTTSIGVVIGAVCWERARQQRG